MTSVNELYRKAGRYQTENQKPSIKDGQTIQWHKEKRQRGKQWSTKHYTKH
jgi:hypothetical protein